MARTQTKGSDIGDGAVGRSDLNTATTGSAVITKIVDGSLGIKISTSTGADAGTGDVVLKIDTAYLDAIYATLTGDDFTGNISAPNMIEGYTTTATAAGTTTLTAVSNFNQFLTGTSTQTIVLPVVSTLKLGHPFWIVNKSTGVVTVNSSGGNAVVVVPAGGSAFVICVLLTGTTAASWHAKADGTGTVTSVTAGNGMTQSGTASVNPTLNIVSHAGSAGSIGTINVGTDAIGVNLGTTSTTACAGNDSRLSDARTPTDNSASYTKQGTEFKGDLTITSNAIDWSTGFYKAITLSANTTYTFTNLEKGKTIILKMTGNYTPTFPAAVVVINGGAYSGSKTNYIIMTCIDSTTATVLTTIQSI
jgi:hypothetical protein